MDRRRFLGSVAASVGTMPAIAAASGRPEGAGPARRLRVAQMTDTHVFDDRQCPARMRAFLKRFAATAASADLVLHTGDVIMDGLDTERDSVARQWALWGELARALPAPPMYALGNHDVWAKAPATDPRYGKKWAVEALGLPGRFYAFTKGGWRFIVLDSTHPIEQGWYTARIDPEQRDWLERELSATDARTPIAIVSHIPLLSAAVVQWAASEGQSWTVSNGLMHGDSHTLQALLRQHANVKLCLSGHLHLLDTVVYDGITYLGCGAVSGDWWKHHTFHQTRCGFATIDLFADGTFARQYHTYDWPADAP